MSEFRGAKCLPASSQNFIEALVLFSKNKVPLYLECELRRTGGKVRYDNQIIEWLPFIEPLKTNLPRDSCLVAASGYRPQ